MTVTYSAPPQPVPELVRCAVAVMPQCTVPLPTPPRALVQGVPAELGAWQLAVSGEPSEAALPEAPRLQQRELSPRRRPIASDAPGHGTRAASLRTAPLVAPAPATLAALRAPLQVPVRHELAGARAPYEHAAHRLPAPPSALLGGPAPHGAAARRTQSLAVAGDVAVPHSGEHGDGGDGCGTEAEQPGVRGGAGNGAAPCGTPRGGGRGDGASGGDGPLMAGTA